MAGSGSRRIDSRYLVTPLQRDGKTVEVTLKRGRVAYFAINSGTNQLYHQSAVWSECNLLRLENGKIVEWWGVEDVLSEWRQLGFHFQAPG